MLTVKFFAQTRELVATDALQLEECFQTVGSVREALAERGNKWQLALCDNQLLMAVNQVIVSADHPLRDGDEIAFFPPVTGG